MDNNPIALTDVLGLSTRGDGGTGGSCPTFGGSNEASSSDNIGGSIASGIMNVALLNDHNAFTLYNTSNIVGQIGHQVNPSNFKASLSNLHSNLQINANLDILYWGSKSVVKIHQKAHENSLNRKER